MQGAQTRRKWWMLWGVLVAMALTTHAHGRRRARPDPMAQVALKSGYIAAEAQRLVSQGTERGATPAGAVDLMRLAALGPWRPQGEISGALHAAAKDARRGPLVRAVAWWLLRDHALRTLDLDTVAEAREALGLISAFLVRSGEAPDPLAPIKASEWRVYPEQMGHGMIWLDAVIRPASDNEATLVTEIEAPGGGAILRLGFDDQVKVWLNGDQIYEAKEPHRSWLDQVAVPLVLKAGRNRLMFQVRQDEGAWRLVARLTDPEGVPLKGLKASTAIEGPAPEPLVDAEPPEQYAHIWRALWAISELDAPPAQGLRDLADYARVTGLPNHDQTEPQVAVEAAWEDDPSPRSLRAWVRLLPEARQQAIRTTHLPEQPILLADVVADLFDRLEVAEGHYYARRHRMALEQVSGILEIDERFAPAWRLKALVMEDIGLPNTAVQILEGARSRCGELPGLLKASASSLKAAGRHAEALGALQSLIERKLAGPDDHYRLANTLHLRGRADEAVQMLDGVSALRPELWYHALEAAQIRLTQGRRTEALERLLTLDRQIPEASPVVELLAEVYARLGKAEEARTQLARALKLSPSDELLERRLDALSARGGPERLGPELTKILETSDPEGASAHVLYHHARTEVQPTGLASRRLRRVVRLLDAEGARQFAEWSLAYVPGRQRIEIHTARLYREGQPPSSPARGDRDLSEPEYRLYYDLRAEVLTFDQPRPGDVIEVSWSITDIEGDPAFPGYYGELAYLQEYFPRARSVVDVAGPAADALAIELADRGVSIERSALDGGGARFTAEQVPAVAWEAGMPGGSSLRAFVHVSTAKGWGEIDTRYRTLLQDRDKPDRALKALAREWTRGVEGAEAQIGRLYAEVAARTRYVGLELGMHSFQPEQPRITLARGYGDCKDKATLLIALARALGHEAHLTLVRTRSSGALPPKPASLAIFNHAIVYLPGLDRFLDPTVDRNDPWTLPPSDQGAVAFIVGRDAEPRQVPVQSSKRNVTEWEMVITLDRRGVGRGQWRWETRGHPGTVARRALEPEGSRAELVARALGDRFPGVKILDAAVEGIKPAFDPVTASGRLTLPLSLNDGKVEVPLGGGPWGLVSSYAEAAQRANPLELTFKHTWRQRLELRLPQGWSAKAVSPVKLESPFGTFEATAEVSPGGVVLDATLRLDVRQIPADQYPAFRSWLSRIDQALAQVVEVGGA
ncbi:MAG: DUF3857 domain-containing protein [Bradymonadia bacterium]